MTLTTDPTLFALYAACSAVLVISLYVLGMWTATLRFFRKVVINAEDPKVIHGATVAAVDHPDVQRVKRTHMHALENAVPFFVIGFLYTLISPNVTMARVLFLVFLAARLGHAAFYLAGKQPYRSLTHGVTMLVILIMTVQVLIAAL